MASVFGLSAQENQTNLTDSISDFDSILDEVVVVGYGVQKKSDVNGAISLLSPKKLENRSFADVTQALNGTNGVQVLSKSGYPGSTSSLRIRGISSNSSSAVEPLYIVDGLQVSSIDYLDASDIKSIEVLKDAASAAIYGAQAGNGVVIITTKTGHEGKFSVSFNSSFGIERLGVHPKMMNATQYVDYMTKAQAINQTDLETYWDGKTNTDWMKELFTSGNTQKYNVAIEGGSQKADFYLSITSLSNNGIIKGDYDTYKRLNVQLNADYQFNKWLKVSTANNFSRTKNNGVYALDGASTDNLMLSANATDPLTPTFYAPDQLPDFMQKYLENGYPLMKDSDGNYLATSKFNSKSPNPFYFLLRSTDVTKRYRLNGATSLILTPQCLEGLTFTSRMGYTLGINDNKFYQPAFFYIEGLQGNEILRSQIYYEVKYQWENFVNYSHQFGQHKLDFMAGMSYINNNNNYAKVQGTTTDVNDALLAGEGDNFLYPNYVSENATKSIFGVEGRTSAISYFGRVDWNYANRYFLEASLRADAFDSSKLPQNSRWGYFPSVSAGWNVMNESFMKSVSSDKLSYLKLRASFGINGNVNALTGHSYVYSRTVSLGNSGYQFDANSSYVTQGATINRLANQDIKWETTRQYDFGLDAKFLNDRLSFGFDYYYKQTRDLLVQIDAPYETGFTKVWANGGTVVNKGIELELGWKDRIGDFHYSVSANLSRNRNRVTYVTPKLTRINGQIVNMAHYATVMEEGYPLWSFRGYRFEGIDPETGSAMLADLNDDGKVSNEDQEILGSAQPDFTYGISLTMDWKGIDFSLNGYGSKGNKVWFGYLSTDYLARNLPEEYYTNAWNKAGDVTNYPKMGQASSDTRYARSSAMVHDGSYFRIAQMQLGYSLPTNILRKVYIKNLRIFVSLDDFFTFADYIGGDPSCASTNVSSGMGVDMGNYMTTRKCLFGLNVKF